MKRILIVDDNKIFIDILYSELNKNKNIKNNFLIDKVEFINKKSAEYVYNNLSNIDILLLDLQMPEVSGLDILEYIKSSNYRPKIIILTAEYIMLSGLMLENLNVSGIFIKPFDTKQLIKQIINISDELTRKKIYDEISATLSKFEFNKTSIGYKYLTECIYLCVKNDSLMSPIETNLYPTVAKKYSVPSTKKVKWSIAKTLKSMNTYTNQDTLNEFFKYQPITAKMFIYEMYSTVRKKLENG